jgi:hypothetical protein
VPASGHDRGRIDVVMVQMVQGSRLFKMLWGQLMEERAPLPTLTGQVTIDGKIWRTHRTQKARGDDVLIQMCV